MSCMIILVFSFCFFKLSLSFFMLAFLSSLIIIGGIFGLVEVCASYHLFHRGASRFFLLSVAPCAKTGFLPMVVCDS